MHWFLIFEHAISDIHTVEHSTRFIIRYSCLYLLQFSLVPVTSKSTLEKFYEQMDHAWTEIWNLIGEWSAVDYFHFWTMLIYPGSEQSAFYLCWIETCRQVYNYKSVFTMDDEQYCKLLQLRLLACFTPSYVSHKSWKWFISGGHMSYFAVLHLSNYLLAISGL